MSGGWDYKHLFWAILNFLHLRLCKQPPSQGWVAWMISANQKTDSRCCDQSAVSIAHHGAGTASREMSSWHFNKQSAKLSEIKSIKYHLIIFTIQLTQFHFLYFFFRFSDKIVKRIFDFHFNSFQISACSYWINSISSYDGEIPLQTIDRKSLLWGSVCCSRVCYASIASAQLFSYTVCLLIGGLVKDVLLYTFHFYNLSFTPFVLIVINPLLEIDLLPIPFNNECRVCVLEQC